MTVLVGRSNPADFDGTFSYANSATTAWLNGTAGAIHPQVAASSGTAATIHTFVNAWTSATQAKFAIYNNTNNLIGSAVFTSAQGVGELSQTITLSEAIVNTNNYYCMFYISDTNALVLDVDTSGVDRRRSTSAGSFTTPNATTTNGTFQAGSSEFSWWLEDAPAGGSIPVIMNQLRNQGIN